MPPSVVDSNGTASSTFSRMASTAGFSPASDMGTPYAHPRTRLLWVAAAVVGACYGTFLIVTALRLPSGAELTGQFCAATRCQGADGGAARRRRADPSDCAGTTLAARRAALLGGRRLSVGDARGGSRPSCWVSALSWWRICASWPRSFRWPPARRRDWRPQRSPSLACVALLVWFWPRLIADQMAVPVTLYIAVLGAMVCAALMARLPTPWTALGAVCFAVSDAHDRHRQVRSGAPRRWPCRSGGRTRRRCCSSPRVLLRPHVRAVCYICLGDGHDRPPQPGSRPSTSRSRACCRCCRCRTWTANSTIWCRRNNPTMRSQACGCGCGSTVGWSTRSYSKDVRTQIMSASSAGSTGWCPPNRC